MSSSKEKVPGRIGRPPKRQSAGKEDPPKRGRPSSKVDSRDSRDDSEGRESSELLGRPLEQKVIDLERKLKTALARAHEADEGREAAENQLIDLGLEKIKHQATKNKLEKLQRAVEVERADWKDKEAEFTRMIGEGVRAEKGSDEVQVAKLQKRVDELEGALAMLPQVQREMRGLQDARRAAEERVKELEDKMVTQRDQFGSIKNRALQINHNQEQQMKAFEEDSKLVREMNAFLVNTPVGVLNQQLGAAHTQLREANERIAELENQLNQVPASPTYGSYSPSYDKYGSYSPTYGDGPFEQPQQQPRGSCRPESRGGGMEREYDGDRLMMNGGGGYDGWRRSEQRGMMREGSMMNGGGGGGYHTQMAPTYGGYDGWRRTEPRGMHAVAREEPRYEGDRSPGGADDSATVAMLMGDLEGGAGGGGGDGHSGVSGGSGVRYTGSVRREGPSALVIPKSMKKEEEVECKDRSPPRTPFRPPADFSATLDRLVNSLGRDANRDARHE